eukprot:TRINITY_DN13617_c0_g3_i1.p1 TRINITY_DN13617_c0_g3~~TRINITY_DN13617_c0_g3_i1.p1  ORF type:complete len:329 (-),score=61.99 TRINITY_DN13617_c0_g3_i1:39-983(-)
MAGMPGMVAMPGMPAAGGMMPQAPGMGMMANPMMPGMMLPNAGSMGAMPAAGMHPMMMMNPMMMGMNPMMMNPMMMGGCNPMMMGMGGMAVSAAPAAAAATAVPAESGGQPTATSALMGAAADSVHPKVAALCRDFRIEDRLMRKLNDILQRRPTTFEDDLVTLREKLGQPKVEVGILLTQLAKGTFVNKSSMSPEMCEIVEKYKLDHRATERLVESMMRRPKNSRAQDLKDLDIRLASADRPTGLLMQLLQGLDSEGKFPPAPRSLGLPSELSYPLRRDRASPKRSRSRSGKKRSKSRRRSRSRSRSRSRRRR